MSNLAIFILKANDTVKLADILAKEGLLVFETGPSRITEEGPEQDWTCADGNGALCFFAISDPHDRQGMFARDDGEVCLIEGPIASVQRKEDALKAWLRLETALAEIGARRLE